MGHVGRDDTGFATAIMAYQQRRGWNFVTAFARNVEVDEIGHRTVKLGLAAEAQTSDLEVLALVARHFDDAGLTACRQRECGYRFTAGLADRSILKNGCRAGNAPGA